MPLNTRAPIGRHTRFARRTFLGTLVTAATGFLVFALVRLVIIFPYTPEDLIRSDPPESADAVVVLEGAIDRIDRSLDLIEAGYSRTLIYPGAYRWPEEQLHARTASRGLEYELLVMRDTRSTFDEALNTREILRDRPEIDSILLVTSDYHSHRTAWIFRKVLPARVSIISTPSFQSGWLLERADIPGSWHNQMFRDEQRKFLAYFFMYGWRVYR